MATTAVPRKCKAHDYTHRYEACPLCGCQYCGRIYTRCPRTSWHPQHAATPEERARRAQALADESYTRPGGVDG